MRIWECEGGSEGDMDMRAAGPCHPVQNLDSKDTNEDIGNEVKL